MKLNKYVIQLCYSGVNWVFLILLKYLLVSDEYSSFMYYFVYSHAFAGILNYIFTYKLLKKDYKPTHAKESLTSLLFLFLLSTIVSLVYSGWFLVFSVSFCIKELFFRDVIKSGKDFNYLPIILYLFSFSLAIVLLSLKSCSKEEIFILLSATNIIFSYPLILKMSFSINNWPKLNWDDISMPLLGSSKNILISEVLIKSLNPLGYGEFYYVRNLLGPLGQLSNFVNVGVSGKRDNTSNKIINIVIGITLIILFSSLGYFFSRFRIVIGAVIFALWETLYGMVSFRIYVDEKLLKLVCSQLIVLIMILLVYYGLVISSFSALILFFIFSSLTLCLSYINREG